MAELSNFGDSLADLMLEKGLTHISLGNAIGVANSNIHGWKTGKHSLKLSTALRLADYFECSLEFLLGRTEIRCSFTPQKCPPFFDRLLAVMKENNISQYRLTKGVLSRGHFSLWKKGADPFVDTLLNLTAYFDCTLDYLVGRDS